MLLFILFHIRRLRKDRAAGFSFRHSFNQSHSPGQLKPILPDTAECWNTEYMLTHPAYILTQIAVATLNISGILLSAFVVHLIASSQVSSFN